MAVVRRVVGIGGMIYAASVGARMAGTLSAVDWETTTFGGAQVAASVSAMAGGLLVSVLCLRRPRVLAEVGPTDDADRDQAIIDARATREEAADGEGRLIF